MQQELMSTIEIRKLLGVVRQRAYQITQHPSFPAPLAVLGIGKVWDGAAVRAWAAARAGKPIAVPEPRRATWPPIPDELLDGASLTDVVAQQQHARAAAQAQQLYDLEHGRVPVQQELEPWDYPDEIPPED